MAILLATLATNAIASEQKEAETLRNQQLQIEQSIQEKAKLDNQMRDAEKQIEVKTQETEAKDQEIKKRDEVIQEKDRQLQAKREAQVKLAATRTTTQVAPSIPARPTGGGAGSGSCAAEIAKYSWNQSVATAVSRAEAGLNTSIVNYNPATKDHSVGCFQINIWGANAASRPSESALKDATTNVAFAWRLYAGAGHSFRSNWRVCDSKVSCY